jgi:hypothetical protein
MNQAETTDRRPLDYAAPTSRFGARPRLAQRLGIAGWIVGLIATLIPLWYLIDFNEIAPGTSMRPMAMTAVVGLGAAAGLLVALPLSLACLLFGWRTRRMRWLSFFSVLMSIAAIFLGILLFNHIVAARGFILEP